MAMMPLFLNDCYATVPDSLAGGTPAFLTFVYGISSRFDLVGRPTALVVSII
jgi:hypothetical protein